jgi:hypothetical protein
MVSGMKKLDGEFIDGEFLIHGFWNENGEQLLKDGTGLFIAYREYGLTSYLLTSYDRAELEYCNYKLHGRTKVFQNNLLMSLQEFKDGKRHGYFRFFYENGKVSEETVYVEGALIWRKVFPKSDSPKPMVSFQYIIDDDSLIERGFTNVDQYAVCINEERIRKNIRFPELLFHREYLYRDIQASTCLWLDVDKRGHVTNVQFSSASMTNGEEFIAVSKKMRFNPAMKDGIPVDSCIYIIARFEII